MCIFECTWYTYMYLLLLFRVNPLPPTLKTSLKATVVYYDYCIMHSYCALHHAYVICTSVCDPLRMRCLSCASCLVCAESLVDNKTYLHVSKSAKSRQLRGLPSNTTVGTCTCTCIYNDPLPTCSLVWCACYMYIEILG